LVSRCFPWQEDSRRHFVVHAHESHARRSSVHRWRDFCLDTRPLVGGGAGESSAVEERPLCFDTLRPCCYRQQRQKKFMVGKRKYRWVSVTSIGLPGRVLGASASVERVAADTSIPGVSRRVYGFLPTSFRHQDSSHIQRESDMCRRRDSCFLEAAAAEQVKLKEKNIWKSIRIGGSFRTCLADWEPRVPSRPGTGGRRHIQASC